MDDMPIFSRGEEVRIRQMMAVHYDAPAYVRRAQAVQAAFDRLVAQCRQKRDEWLPMVRTRLGTLKALAGDWQALRPLLAEDEQVRTLDTMHADLAPRLRVPVSMTTSVRTLRRALRELIESIAVFNRRWLKVLATVDVGGVNELREGYNRWYLLEKECAIGSARLARIGYKELPPLTSEELARLLPPLPVVRLA